MTGAHGQQHHIAPTLQCDTLEDGQQGVENVVKRCHVKVWVQDESLPAKVRRGTILVSSA